MGELVHGNFGRSNEVPLSKKRLALLLRRSTRWVEMRVREGMPSQMERGRRIFRETEVRAWLESREKGVANG